MDVVRHDVGVAAARDRLQEVAFDELALVGDSGGLEVALGVEDHLGSTPRGL